MDRWNIKINDKLPQLIHCIHSNVLLVSRIYRCDQNHNVFGHFPDIIKMFPTGCRLVPFHLWHRSGITVALLDYITDMIEAGISLRHIETVLSDNRLRLFYNIKRKAEVLQIGTDS